MKALVRTMGKYVHPLFLGISTADGDLQNQVLAVLQTNVFRLGVSPIILTK